MATTSANRFLKILLGVVFIAVIVFYTVFQSEDFARGPEITILSPEGGILLDEPLVEVRGQALRVNEITLNGNPIFIDESGGFSENIVLVPGLNIITIEAHDKFERRVSKELELLYK